MKEKVCFGIAVLLSGIVFAADPAPVLHYDFTAPVIRQGGKYEAPKLPGKVRMSDSPQALILTGEKGKTVLTVPHGSDITLADGGTLYALVCFDNDGKVGGKAESHDMILFKKNEFLLGRSWGGLYFNGGDGKKYSMWTVTEKKMLPAKKWVAVAATVTPTEKGTVVRLYIDGKKEAAKYFKFKQGKPASNPVTIGEGWGGPWYFSGKLGKVLIFDRALSDSEVAGLAASEPYLKNSESK